MPRVGFVLSEFVQVFQRFQCIPMNPIFHHATLPSHQIPVTRERTTLGEHLDKIHSTKCHARPNSPELSFLHETKQEIALQQRKRQSLLELQGFRNGRSIERIRYS
ncbi:hypothetical protein O6H91_06G100100 [Diphasiastrum complanatum]|uniref:Uncharacterized protein n=1 Tax=Diphasiastrum complanatum TaxID=34168 RepID=A0ACC2DH18_DIPCM|nr:hypothetical protein O6H91_06G100100 [Diphasiastrum complanatum]